MLSRVYRLTDRRDFSGVYQRGRVYRSDLVILHVLPRGKTEPRFGISVSKKVGGAVQRNRVKRRLREACRSAIGAGAPPFDYVLVARPAALEADFGRLCRVVTDLLTAAAKGGVQKGTAQKKSRPGGAASGNSRPEGQAAKATAPRNVPQRPSGWIPNQEPKKGARSGQVKTPAREEESS